MSIDKTQQAWLESLGVAILLGALAALLPYLSAGTPVNWSLVLAAGLSSGILALQAALRGLGQPAQGPLAPEPITVRTGSYFDQTAATGTSSINYAPKPPEPPKP